MRHFEYLDTENIFFKQPQKIYKHTNKEILKYSLGANLYMNGGKDFYSDIVSGKLKKTKAISICFEDATRECDVEAYEENVVKNLGRLNCYLQNNNTEDIPLIFVRVRNYNQFINFTEKLDKDDIKQITGFIFPKFNLENGEEYLKYILYLREKFDDIFYGMPIIETEEVIYKESRMDNLVRLRELIDKYSELILNVRVGGTDFSSKFSLRRSVDFSIYDIRVISDCLIDIVNVFGRAECNYVVSAPVWEYFSKEYKSPEIQGLIKEVKMDKENGFCGKTVIHPTQCIYVNSTYSVLYEQYIDALEIVEARDDGGVFKGYGDNKMNEVKPHLNWAKKVLSLAAVYGVLKEGILNEEVYLAKFKNSVKC